ncbi:MAG: hypothetical protein Q9218_007474, partial [Villophora microphyllina]
MQIQAAGKDTNPNRAGKRRLPADKKQAADEAFAKDMEKARMEDQRTKRDSQSAFSSAYATPMTANEELDDEDEVDSPFWLAELLAEDLEGVDVDYNSGSAMQGDQDMHQQHPLGPAGSTATA